MIDASILLAMGQGPLGPRWIPSLGLDVGIIPKNGTHSAFDPEANVGEVMDVRVNQMVDASIWKQWSSYWCKTWKNVQNKIIRIPTQHYDETITKETLTRVSKIMA